MEALKYIPYLFLVICVAGIIAGASALTLGEFKDTTTDAGALAALGNATSGINTMSAQFGTIGIIAIMTIIIALLAGVMGYFAFFR